MKEGTKRILTKESDYLEASINKLKGIGKKRAELLDKLGIKRVGDLLFYFPRSYSDRRYIAKLAQIRLNEVVNVIARVKSCTLHRVKGGLVIVEAVIEDDSGVAKAIWFGRSFLSRVFRPGVAVFLSGRVGERKGLTLINPEYEILSIGAEEERDIGNIVPIYSLTEGINQKFLRRSVRLALKELPKDIPDVLPSLLRSTHDFPGIYEALQSIHFPENPQIAAKAKLRFLYEKLLILQLGILQARRFRQNEETGIQHIIDGSLVTRFRRNLSFTLTQEQEKVLNEILTDMASPRPMARLLHGDVGCGKTIVAIHAVLAACDGGYQTAFLAPTEVLADQHGHVLRKYLEPLGIRLVVLTGATRNPREVRRAIKQGEILVVVGTHALIEKSTEFKNLGLVVVDEQHRFGVLQRERLFLKGFAPDILQMSATPIPRTLALTIYGGMDISVIDEKPPGRVPVKTRWIPPSKVTALYKFVCEQARQGFQTYYVFPTIDDSEIRNVSGLIKRHEELSKAVFGDLQTEVLHGRLSSERKEEVMERFRAGEIHVLFTTSVIEVGVDCPRATIIIIEDAAQFGLAQLHQLRGRVGRSLIPSYCFLLGLPRTPEGQKRIEIMCRTTNGFEIAEEDLKLRGPGELTGFRQAGFQDWFLEEIIREPKLLEMARQQAEELLKDPLFWSDPEYNLLRDRSRSIQMISL